MLLTLVSNIYLARSRVCLCSFWEKYSTGDLPSILASSNKGKILINLSIKELLSSQEILLM